MSDISLRKIKTYFHGLDFEKRGFITVKDFERMAEHCAQRENAKSDLRGKSRKAFHDLWLKYTLAAASEPKHKRQMTELVLIESLKMQKDDPEFKKNFKEVILSVFAMMDLNRDGYLQIDELRRGFENIGVQDSGFVIQSFKVIDTNHDGLISFDEFIYAHLDFLFSEDENSPNNLFWGPLL